MNLFKGILIFRAIDPPKIFSLEMPKKTFAILEISMKLPTKKLKKLPLRFSI